MLKQAIEVMKKVNTNVVEKAGTPAYLPN